MWTVKIIDGRNYFGVYSEPGAANGIWELKGSKFLPVYSLNHPVTGIAKHQKGLLVSTLSGLFFYDGSGVKKLNSLAINRMSIEQNEIWLSTQEGTAHVPVTYPEAIPEFISMLPAQIARKVPTQNNLILFGTLQNGVISMRSADD